MSGESRQLHEIRQEATVARERGEIKRAHQLLTEALSFVVAPEEEYVGALAELRDVLVAMGEHRAALSVDWYAGSEKSQGALLENVPPIDRARTLQAWADGTSDPERRRMLYALAGDAYEAAGLVAQAAIAREKGEDFLSARALWSRLAELLSSSSGDLYAAGLARFNLARMARRTAEHQSARQAEVAAVHLLEEAADRFETIGQRERAFDCFQVLIAVGKESGEVEHVLEGYVNVIRILREDNLRYYALQSYEEAVATTESQGEISAAATLAREMSQYARKEGLPAVANHGMMLQARLWQAVAESAAVRGLTPELAENALLAAVIAYGEAGQYRRVGATYEALAALPLDDARQAHYRRATGRYAKVADLEIQSAPLPSHLRHDAGFPEVWHVDLVEWEQRGSVSQACGSLVLESEFLSEVSRRHALIARLKALEVEADAERGPEGDAEASTQRLVSLAQQLVKVDYYALLAPLEKLFERREVAVRVAVVKALSRFLFKRTFITLRAALADPEPSVQRAAGAAIEELRFPHAFDPLARIYRESDLQLARLSALRAMAKIDTTEAAEMLLGVIEHDGPEERAAAVDALKGSIRGSRFNQVATAAMSRLVGPAKTAVRDILQERLS